MAGIPAGAAIDTDKIMTPVCDQPDGISGRINITATTERDTYVSIYKRTPEFPTEGYPVYETVIDAGTVHVSYVYIFNLEYNNYSFENQEYEGDYVVKIGIPTSKGGQPVYYTDIITIEDSDYTEYETEFTYNINLTSDELEAPLSETVTEGHTTTTALTFSAIDFERGDANCDGTLNAADAAYIAKMIAQQRTEELPSHADFNKDGKVSAYDAALIAKYLVEIAFQKP